MIIIPGTTQFNRGDRPRAEEGPGRFGAGSPGAQVQGLLAHASCLGDQWALPPCI